MNEVSPGKIRRVLASCHSMLLGIVFLFLSTQILANDVESQPARIEQFKILSGAGFDSDIIEETLPGSSSSTRSNKAIIFQVGHDNTSRISQFRTENYFLGNMAWIYQNGNGNVADIHQIGGSNIGIVHQHGDGLTAAMDQAGNELSAAINQYGLNAEATINQFGSASQGVSIEQLSRSGAGMTVTVETR